MNHRLFITLVCGLGAMAASAQTESGDSLSSRELEEVVVEGRTQRVIDHGVEYTPAKKMKRAAADATRLLELMNIPQLEITPGSMKVRTYAGKDVAMFIDFKEATEEDLQGLRPEDVLRVEVLQYPQNPRFRSQANVVNFIMRKYDWGGYTKLTLTGNTLNRDRGNGLLYSKFVKGLWTFDANANGTIVHNDKDFTYERETFRDITAGGRHFDEVTRTSSTGDGYLRKSNSQSVAFRATYQTATTEINHSVSFSRSATPLSRKLQNVEFSEDLFAASSARSLETGQSLSPRLRGYYYFSLPEGNSVVASWNFSYGSTRRHSTYQLGDMAPILNINREKSYQPNLNFAYSKKFAHDNTLRTSLMSYNSIYRTHYAGSYDGMQKLLSSENMLFLEYMQNWKRGLSLYSRVGVSYVIGRVNGITTLKQWNPRLGLQLQYKINDRHSASVEGWWGNDHPTPSSSNSAMVQSDELMWLQGNPDLRNTTYVSASGSYTYIPMNRLSLSATAEYNGYLNKTVNDYFTMAGYDGLVRKEINSGDYHNFSGYLSATLRLLNNSLSLRASGQVKRMVATGIDAQSMNVISGSMQANYYFRNFAFVLYYQTPQKGFTPFNNDVRFRYKSSYGLLVNFATGDFKANLQFSNWFDKHNFCYTLNTPHYASEGRQWAADLARSLQLTVSYTIPYGKKVNRNNEIQTSSAAGSAILK